MQKVILDLLPGGVAPIVYASQYDDGRSIRFMLTEGGPDSQYSLHANDVITCNLTKPDGTETVINVANPGGGEHYVDLVNGADDYDQAGAYLGEIVLTKNARVIGSANFVLKVEEDAYGGQITTLTATGNPCTFTTDLADALVSLTAKIVCGGGGGTPSTPIPIVGHSELNLTRCGVNLFDEDLLLNATGWSKSGDYYVGSVGQLYTVFGVNGDFWHSENGVDSLRVSYTAYVDNASANARAVFNYTDGTTSFAGIINSTTETVYSVVSDVGKTVRSVTFDFSNDATLHIKDFSINYPSSKTAYEPYNGQTFTVAFGQTVYGGVYDKSGRLTIDTVKVVLDGTQPIGLANWHPNTNTRAWIYFLTTFPDLKDYEIKDSNISSCKLKADKLKTVTYQETNGISTNDIPSISIVGGDYWSIVVRVNDTTLENDTAINNYLSQNPIEVCYELATPIVIDVPSISVFAENGTNNIVSDCLGDVDVTYIKKV